MLAEARACVAGSCVLLNRLPPPAAAAGVPPALRVGVMDASNPRLVLRNWIAQAAISAAQGGDYSVTRRLLQLLADPYSGDGDMDLALPPHAAGEAADAAGAAGMRVDGSGACPLVRLQADGKPPAWAAKLCVTCSS